MRWPKIVACGVLLMLAIGGFAFAALYDPIASMNFGENDNGYNAYGEVPIPGQQTLHLPAGQVAISLHAETVGVPEAGLPIPELKLDIDPPNGVADPQVTEKFGGTTTINNDSRRQVWVAQVAQEGDYRITTDGQVGPFVSARLAFGHASAAAPLGVSHMPIWIRPAAAVLATVASIAAVALFRSASTRQSGPDVWPNPVSTPQPEQPFLTSRQPSAPDPDDVRIEKLKTLADLHASGVLTDAEFQTEKRRIGFE
jgi:hypothetical protein